MIPESVDPATGLDDAHDLLPGWTAIDQQTLHMTGEEIGRLGRVVQNGAVYETHSVVGVEDEIAIEYWFDPCLQDSRHSGTDSHPLRILSANLDDRPSYVFRKVKKPEIRGMVSHVNVVVGKPNPEDDVNLKHQ